MFVIGEDDYGNVIIKTTSNVGKTDEEIIILNEAQYSFFQELSKEVVKLALKVCVCQYRFQDFFPGIEEKYIELLYTSQCHCEETLADMAEMMELGTTEMHEEQRMVNIHQRKTRRRIKNRIWPQAKSTLKYKRYELRIYTSLCKQ